MIRSRRRLLLVGGALLISLVCAAHAQPGGSASKVTWTVQGDTLAVGTTGTVTLQASVAEGWKMYAPDSPPPTVGVAVTDLEANRSGVVLGTDSLSYTGGATAYDPNFGKDVHFFSGEARLRLPIAISADARSGTHALQGTLRFMVCTEEICLPPATEQFNTTVVATD
jgi:thiol:disulfide interchange protein DsbD